MTYIIAKMVLSTKQQFKYKSSEHYHPRYVKDCVYDSDRLQNHSYLDNTAMYYNLQLALVTNTLTMNFNISTLTIINELGNNLFISAGDQ